MGLALAQRSLAERDDVVLVGRLQARLDTAREQLRHERVRTVVADIGHADQVAALFEPCGPLDHIVSTAADIDNAYQPLPSPQVEAALRVVDSTFIDPLWLAQHDAPAQQ
jgi:NAD(P)-dependent dehydrogenase (short-subunit alcohol dehydrogenase family)